MSRKKNAGPANGSDGIRAALVARLEALTALSAKVHEQHKAETGRTMRQDVQDAITAVARAENVLHLITLEDQTPYNPLALLMSGMGGPSYRIQDALDEALRAFFAGRGKMLADSVLRWLTVDPATVPDGIEPPVIPATPYAVRELLQSGGPDGDGFISMHNDIDPETGRCCGRELTHLAHSPSAMGLTDNDGNDIPPAPSVVALMNKGRMAEALAEADTLDIGTVLYAQSDGLIPLVSGGNEVWAEHMRVTLRGQIASLGIEDATGTPASDDEDEDVFTIDAETEEEAIRRLIDGSGGPRGPETLPPPPPFMS